MKGKKIIIVLIIINILLLGVIYNVMNKNYLNNDKLILKAMTETEYETQIDSLNQTHQNYQDYIATSKIQLATAITNKGVETASTSTFETMATNINSIVTNPDASLISYDNTSSGLTSTNVQGAVDELSSSIYTLNTNSVFIRDTTSTAINNITSFTQKNFAYYNLQGLKRISFSFKALSNIPPSAYTHIGTLSNNMIPTNDLIKPIIIHVSYKPVYLFINLIGEIFIYPVETIPSGTEFYIDETYF